MHSSEIYEEAENLVGEDGPVTEAYESLSYHQRIAVLMLSRGAKLKEVCLELQKSPRTLQYWMAKPEFRQALHEATNAVLKEASALLHSKCAKAIERLEHIASDYTEPASARVAACRTLVNLTIRMAATVERNDQITLLREEVQQLSKALHAEKASQERKTMQESAIAGASVAVPPVCAPCVPSVPMVPSIPTATASPDRSYPVLSGPIPASASNPLASVPYVPLVPSVPYHAASLNQPTTAPPSQTADLTRTPIKAALRGEGDSR